MLPLEAVEETSVPCSTETLTAAGAEDLIEVPVWVTARMLHCKRDSTTSLKRSKNKTWPRGYIPIDPAVTYQLATNNFIANGGDDFSMLAGAASRYDTGWLLSDSLAEYLDAHAPVAPATEERISDTPETENPE